MKIHITITGAPRCGKTTIAQQLDKFLQEQGHTVTRHENQQPISPHRLRMMESDFAKFDGDYKDAAVDMDPREIVINEQWEKGSDVEALAFVFTQVCEAAGICMETTTLTARNKRTGVVYGSGSLADFVMRATGFSE